MKSTLIAITLLLIVALSRFVSFAGFDPVLYPKVLQFYSYGPFRMGIFLSHFVGLAVIGYAHLRQLKPSMTVFCVAVGALLAVSLLRHFIPVFIVAVVGDYLVLRCYRKEVKANATSSA
jgi:hypothetical protein